MCTHDFKVKLAINHFENSPKQLLVFLEELIKLGRIEALYVGVKNERKALSNKKLVEFLTEHDFENERFKLPKESVTLFPLFLIAIIEIILILAFRSGYHYASILSVLIIVYFMRSMLFGELRELQNSKTLNPSDFAELISLRSKLTKRGSYSLSFVAKDSCRESRVFKLYFKTNSTALLITFESNFRTMKSAKSS